jgi:hypothetical protein
VLSYSIEDRKRLQALTAVHNELKKIKEDQLNDTFTVLIMQKLLARKKAFKEQRNFLFVILSIFISIILVVIGWVIYSAITRSGETQTSQSFTQYIVPFFHSIASAISQIFTPKGMSIFGSIISLGILISGYFFFENLKTSKQKIRNSH